MLAVSVSNVPNKARNQTGVLLLMLPKSFSLIKSTFIVALTALTLAGCVTTGVQKNVQTQDVSSEGLVLINAFRAEHGLKPVMIDRDLVRAAELQVIAMASKDVLSHEVAGDFNARMNAAGFSRAAAAENVGAGHQTVENAIKSWIASPHHRDNMLMKDATRIGLVRGSAPGNRYSSYWALELASNASSGSGLSPTVANSGWLSFLSP